jgi:4-hydroxybenzoate polyprenyltransferase
MGIASTYFLAAVSAALISGAIYFINDRINRKTDLKITKYRRKP